MRGKKPNRVRQELPRVSQREVLYLARETIAGNKTIAGRFSFAVGFWDGHTVSYILPDGRQSRDMWLTAAAWVGHLEAEESDGDRP